MEKTGARNVGGYCDGVGNSYKIVTCKEGDAMVGGCFDIDGIDFPVADVSYKSQPNDIQYRGSGVVVLIK